MSEIYVLVPVGYKPPPAHTTWQGAAMELAGLPSGLYEVAPIPLVKEDE